MRGSRTHQDPMRILALLAVLSLAAGCGFVHKIDVQQGNYVTQDAVAKVKEGMSKSEVRQVLGTPLLNDVFRGNRWDYFFSNVKRGTAQDRKRFSVFFENDKVVRFGGDSHPPAPPPVGTKPAPSLK